jgi:hypothetical protein
MAVFRVHRSCLLLTVALCGLALGADPPSGAVENPGGSDLSPRRRITARVRPDAREIEGTAEVRFRNPTRAPLGKLYLWLYPNAFLRPSPRLNDLNHEWLYPGAFNSGSMEISRIRLQSAAKQEIRADFEERKGVAAKTLLCLSLSPGLPPGRWAVLTCGFKTRLPEKFGPLGSYKGLLTANGGWSPRLAAFDAEEGWLLAAPPPFGPVDVDLALPRETEAVLNGRLFRLGGGRARLHLPNANVVTLLCAEKFHLFETTQGQVRCVLYHERDDASFAEKILEAARAAVRYFQKTVKRPAPDIVCLVPSRVRTVLTQHGGRCGLLSDRILRVLPYPIDLRKYHLREVVFEVFYQLFLPSVAQAEDVRDYNWVAEGCAWRALRRYLRERSIEYSEVKDILGVFSFIPIIDQMLVAPRFPFNDVFYDTFFKSEPHRESVFRYNNRTPFGRIVVEKLRDTLSGDRTEAPLLRHFKRPEPGETLRKASEKACGKDLGWFWTQWRGGYPRVNYAVGDVKVEKLGKGRHRVRVTVNRKGPADFQEPVDLGVVLENGKRYFGRLLVSRDRTDDAYVYPDEPDNVVVDPFGRCRETNESDNKDSRSLRLLVTSFYPRLEVSPDFSDFFRKTKMNLNIWGGFAAIAEGDYSNQVFLNYFYERRGFGFNLGYSRSLGFKIDRTDFPQAVGAFLFFEKLDRDFARVNGPDEGDDQLVTGSLRIFYTLDTRIDPRNPHRGLAFTATAEYADKILGLDFRFTALTLNLRWLLSPARHQVFAFQVRLGTAWGEMPRQRLFSLGGYGGLRGIPESAVLGMSRLILRYEYRHVLFNELDINFFWIGYIRRLGGAFFLETGTVSDRFQDLFRIDGFRASAGYGFKVAFDSFGVRPFIIGMDIAFRLDAVGEGPEIFFTVAQAF